MMILGSTTVRRLRAALLAAGLAAALLACGGGTSQQEVFKPDRYLAFGDETSVLTSGGHKYGVNVINTDGVLECGSQPIWTQAVAAQYSFGFAECNPNAVPTPQAFVAAAPGAKVDDLAAQVDAQAAAGRLSGKVLVTVLVGMHDVLEQYATYPGRSEEQITAELRLRGERLAAQVNRLVDLGAKVIVSTVPDLGVTPFGLKEKADKTDTDRAALLTRLGSALNARLRVNMLNDGRYVGLVLADELVQAMVRSPSSYGVNDATRGACTVALPDCTSRTLLENATSSTYLWADDLHMAYGGHLRLGVLAVARAAGNPF